MIKRTIAHNEIGGTNVAVNVIKGDFTGKIFTENNKEYILAGTLLSLKDPSKDIRQNGVDVIPFSGAGTADAILLNDVEFTHYHTNETGTAIINGTVYLDKLQEVDSTVKVSALPTKIDYVSKKRI